MSENTIALQGEMLNSFVEALLKNLSSEIFCNCHVKTEVIQGVCKVTVYDHRDRELLTSSDKSIQGCASQIGKKLHSFICFKENIPKAIGPSTDVSEKQSIPVKKMPENVLAFSKACKAPELVPDYSENLTIDRLKRLECIEEVYCGLLDILLGAFGGIDIEQIGIKFSRSTVKSARQEYLAELSVFDQATGQTLLTLSTESFFYTAKMLFLRLAGKMEKPTAIKTQQLADMEEHNALNVAIWWRMAWRILRQLSEDEILELRSETYDAEMSRILKTDERCPEWSMWKRTPIPGSSSAANPRIPKGWL